MSNHRQLNNNSKDQKHYNQGLQLLIGIQQLSFHLIKGDWTLLPDITPATFDGNSSLVANFFQCTEIRECRLSKTQDERWCRHCHADCAKY